MKQDKKTVHSGEFSAADSCTICETCAQAFPHYCIYCEKEIKPSMDFYCGDLDKHDKNFPEHICSKCGEKYLKDEDAEDELS